MSKPTLNEAYQHMLEDMLAVAQQRDRVAFTRLFDHA